MSAHTVATGPFSQSQVIQTPEDSKFLFFRSSISVSDSACMHSYGCMLVLLPLFFLCQFINNYLLTNSLKDDSNACMHKINYGNVLLVRIHGNGKIMCVIVIVSTMHVLFIATSLINFCTPVWKLCKLLSCLFVLFN